MNRDISEIIDKWYFEKKGREQGFSFIAGVDEAGRGPLAGPIVAVAVVLHSEVEGIDDSKKLTERKREELFDILMSGEHEIGIAIINNKEIDRIGIQEANYRAMAESILKLKIKPDLVLVDGYNLKGLPCQAWKIIKGDQRSASIGAASIIAKVTRDKIMKEYDKEYPGYGFAKHKGYGTKEHLLAIEKLGPSPIHRLSFAPFVDMSESLLPELKLK
ncbi:MAG TPA: ribonuclease HII [Candidatus Hydrogenedens sp.]|nr:ribonuclease HII [Candidatus Hydrogenedens sp.]HOK08984.1 ribonuclease HII [Candidatus Hydrogenedens sp.]HOL20367.1 ribonuclease HII [Candidatus Hydrogenedens sp.]HPP58710.1 ribonuclease HII [Candidatus Hydrogenedens sp.]